MAITESAKKALRQSAKKQAKNLVYKKKMKELLKKTRSLIAAKNISGAKELLPQVYKILDKAAKVGLIKKNAASRKKSRVAKMLR